MCTSSCTHTYTCSNKQLHSYSYSHEEQTHTAKAAYTRATGLYNHTHRLRICVLTHEKRILKHPQEKLMYISCVNNRAHAHNSTKNMPHNTHTRTQVHKNTAIHPSKHKCKTSSQLPSGTHTCKLLDTGWEATLCCFLFWSSFLLLVCMYSCALYPRVLLFPRVCLFLIYPFVDYSIYFFLKCF